MSQADQTEERPPFLPNSQSARRTDIDVGALVALDTAHPLLAEVPLDASGNLAWQAPRVGWETFGAQSGFGVHPRRQQERRQPGADGGRRTRRGGSS